MIKFGGRKIADIRIGNFAIREVWLGNDVVWKRNDFLTFTALDPNLAVKFNHIPKARLVYSTDGGVSWSDYTRSSTIVLPYAGSTIMFKASPDGNERVCGEGDGYCFSFSGRVVSSGNVNSLLRQEGYENILELPDFCYHQLFKNCTSLISAPELPSTSLGEACYQKMFLGCSSLVSAPKLPATLLSDVSYSSMFKNCTSLISAPALPSVNVPYACYSHMFQGCTSLKYAKNIAASNFGSLATTYMFEGCNNLEEIGIAYTGIFDGSFTGWVDGVSPTGTLRYSGTDTTRGVSAIPEGWTVVPYEG